MEVDTPYTLRAQELRDLYNSLQMRYLTQDERLDVLLTLKHTVKVSCNTRLLCCILICTTEPMHVKCQNYLLIAKAVPLHGLISF